MKSRILLLVVVAALVGCSENDNAVTTDMHEDFDHDHKHQHTGADDHEHDHKDGFTGSHTHDHSHQHRHGEPQHGGRIVSIGHTHHKGEVAHFHAEVMPLDGDRIRFHILTETDDGESTDHAIADHEIAALISIKNQESSSVNCAFTPVVEDEEASEFSMEIPSAVSEGQAFTVMIPKVKLGGIRQNFSFTVSRENSGETKPATLEMPEGKTQSEKAPKEKNKELPASERESSEVSSSD